MSLRLENLVEALRQLSATGSDGFEGFVRDLLTEVTGHGFRLLKSGHQGGIDVLQEPLANGLVIGLEGKRYGEATTLPLDSLQYKLFDATRSHPALDLWLLAATRGISATDAKALRQLGEELGVAVDILDWPSGPDSLPPLAVLCAAAPRVVRAQAYLGNAPEITDCITWIQQHERFEAERERLIQRLRQPDIGYAAARASLAAWLYRSLKDRRTAKANLHSFANLVDPAVKRIHRPTINAALNTWWDCRRDRPLVLLGDEGMGKTWAVLSWWLDRSGEDGEGLPLTLFISASDLSSHDHDPVPLIVEALATRTELRTEEFWKKRLRLWKQDRSDTPKILLVIDGLNQNWMRGWADLLQPLFTDAWRDQVAVILTCRPEHWRTQLKELCNLEPRPYPVSVGRFDDNELAEILSLHGLHRRCFSEALLDLMRIPRLCQIAIARRDKLQESGDITRERLIYEDWKHRLTVHGEHLVSDVEFRHFVSELGRRLRDDLTVARDGTITRREMIERLGRDSGAGPEDLTTTISEIVDGHWLEPTDPNQPHHFRLRPDLAPFALGLALVEELRSVGDMANLPDRLAFFLDPLQGQDFSVDILRAASTVAILEDNGPAAIRHCLVEAWISAQNFRPEDFDACWPLIGANPDLFLELAENIWLRCAGGVHADEILIKAFANAYRWPKVAERLQQRAVEWLAMFWPDPDQGRYLNYNSNTEIAEQHRQATTDRYRQWEAMAPALGIQLPLRCVEEGNASWFSHRAIGVLSFLPRRPFVRALVAWAISRAIMEIPMGIPRHFEEIAWLLRWNPHDPEESSAALLRETDRLLSFGHSITTDGARWLLEALATPEAMVKAAPQPSPSTAAGMSWPNTVRVDQTTGLIHWDHDVALRWPRSEKVPLEATLGLNEHAVDPDLALSPSDAEVLRQLVKNIDIAMLWSRPGSHTLEDLGLKHSTEVLARWAPDALGELIRCVYASAPEPNRETLRTLISYLPSYIFLLNEDQLKDLIAAADLHLKGENVGTPENVFIPLNLWLARLWNRPATEQIDMLSAQPDGFDLNVKHGRILNAPTRKGYEILAQYLTPEAPERQLKTWLGYLSVVGLDQLPSGLSRL